jgi:hypothetical protein
MVLTRRIPVKMLFQLALSLAAISLALPSYAGRQSDPAAAPVEKLQETAKPEAPQPEAPKPDAPAVPDKPDPSTDATRPKGPTDPKALKTFNQAIDWEKQRYYNEALENFQKANRQDGGHCWECLRRAYSLAVKVNAYKDAAAITRQMLPLAETDVAKGNVHYRLAMCLQDQAIN